MRDSDGNIPDGLLKHDKASKISFKKTSTQCIPKKIQHYQCFSIWHKFRFSLSMAPFILQICIGDLGRC